MIVLTDLGGTRTDTARTGARTCHLHIVIVCSRRRSRIIWCCQFSRIRKRPNRVWHGAHSQLLSRSLLNSRMAQAPCRGRGRCAASAAQPRLRPRGPTRCHDITCVLQINSHCAYSWLGQLRFCCSICNPCFVLWFVEDMLPVQCQIRHARIARERA